MARIYVATSWKNNQQPTIVQYLRNAGHQVYDFRAPFMRESGTPTSAGFQWTELDPAWQEWTPEEYRDALLNHPRAAQGYLSDMRAMEWADICLILLPCGRSAHLEAGYMKGRGKRVIFMLEAKATADPELMALMADDLCVDMIEVMAAIGTPIENYRK